MRFLGKLLHDPNLFHLTRYSVSTACFVGLVICFFPVPVGHIPLVAVVSLWLRCNLPIAFALVMISNPFTFAFIYYAAYWVGSWVLQTPPTNFHFELSWQWLKDSFEDVWVPIMVGNLIFGLGSGIVSFLLVRWIWRWRVVTRWQSRKLRKNQNNAEQ